MQNNPIQERIDTLYNKWKSAINKKAVKIVRILSEHDEQDMIASFFKYLLDVEGQQEEFVFVLNSPFSTLESFGNELIKEIEEEVNNWNKATMPDDISFEKIEWNPNYTIDNNKNHAQLFVSNVNSFAKYLFPAKGTKVCFIILMDEADKKEAYQWFSSVLDLNIEPHIVFGVTDTKDFKLYDKLADTFHKEVFTLVPNLDMDGATESLAAMGDMNKPNDKFRMHLVKLMNAVKNRKPNLVDINAKECLTIATKEVEKDPNWLAQIVTIYTILYNDQIGYKDYKKAIFFASKATEAALLTVNLLNDDISYRLVGQTHIGLGSLHSLRGNWNDALQNFVVAKEAYIKCEDFLMQIESFRLCGWAAAEKGDVKLANQYYIEGYQLYPNLSQEIAVNSTFPYIVKKLMYNNDREKIISNIQMNKDMTTLFGEDWKEIVDSYGKINSVA